MKNLFIVCLLVTLALFAKMQSFPLFNCSIDSNPISFQMLSENDKFEGIERLRGILTQNLDEMINFNCYATDAKPTHPDATITTFVCNQQADNTAGNPMYHADIIMGGISGLTFAHVYTTQATWPIKTSEVANLPCHYTEPF